MSGRGHNCKRNLSFPGCRLMNSASSTFNRLHPFIANLPPLNGFAFKAARRLSCVTAGLSRSEKFLSHSWKSQNLWTDPIRGYSGESAGGGVPKLSYESEKSRNRATKVLIVASVDKCGCIQMLGKSNFLGHGVPCPDMGKDSGVHRKGTACRAHSRFPTKLQALHYRILVAKQGSATRNPLQCCMISRRF